MSNNNTIGRLYLLAGLAKTWFPTELKNSLSNSSHVCRFRIDAQYWTKMGFGRSAYLLVSPWRAESFLSLSPIAHSPTRPTSPDVSFVFGAYIIISLARLKRMVCSASQLQGHVQYKKYKITTLCMISSIRYFILGLFT